MEIRRVGLRKLQRSFYKELKDLPIIVTKGKPGRGKQFEDVMVILPYRKDLLNSGWLSDLDLTKSDEKPKGFFGKLFKK